MSAAALLVCYPTSAPLPEEALSRVVRAFPSLVRGMSRADLAGTGVAGFVWSHDRSRSQGMVTDESGSWLTLVGNPSRSDLAGVDGVELLTRVIGEARQRGSEAFATLSPPFVAIYHDSPSQTTHVVVDRAGIQHLYIAQDGAYTWFSSSSLALGCVLGDQIDTSAVGEFLSAGHFVSQRTFFPNVRKLSCGEHVTVHAGLIDSRTTWAPSPPPPPLDPVETYVQEIRRSVAAAGSEPGLFSELTGGLDSRMVLAALLANGTPFTTWTIGEPRSVEIETIERLLKKVDFEHVYVRPPADLGERLPSLTAEMHEVQDGEVNAFEYAPLLIAFEQLEKRRVTSLSGVPGELFRGFYYRVLQAKSRPRLRGVPIPALLHSLTRTAGHHQRGFRREVFSDPRQPILEPVVAFLESSPLSGPAAVTEDFYLRVRMQRFAGRQHTTTGYFCRQGLPYFDDGVVDLALSLPEKLKTRDGYLPRTALMRFSPLLSSVPLGSGAVVAPAELRNPIALARSYLALARKVLWKYGGRPGRLVAAQRPASVRWSGVVRQPTTRDFLHDLLLARDTRLTEYLEPAHIQAAVSRLLDGGPAYPVGVLATMELTLRRAAQQK